MAVSSIILAGGKSSRLGREKHAEVIAGKSLIERVISRLQPLSTEILLVISQSQSEISFSLPEVKTLVDIYPRKGSLGGIYTGLVNSTHTNNIVVACDMPFLNPDLLGYMIDLSPDFDIVIPRIGTELEPLHAVYSKNCIAPMKDLIERGHFKIDRFFDSVKVRYIEEKELNRLDPEHMSFFNINTQEDLEKAIMLAEEAVD